MILKAIVIIICIGFFYWLIANGIITGLYIFIYVLGFVSSTIWVYWVQNSPKKEKPE